MMKSVLLTFFRSGLFFSCEGVNFGWTCVNVSVFVGPYQLAVTSCTVRSIVGTVPPGAGSGYAVSVVVGGQSDVYVDRNFTYGHPRIDSVRCPGADLGVVPPSGVFSSGHRAFVVISGSNFGPPNSSSLVVTCTEPAFGQIITVPGCVRADNHSSILCPVPAGVGTSFTFVVSVSGLVSNASTGVLLSWARVVRC
jgi:hypothetical protein